LHHYQFEEICHQIAQQKTDGEIAVCLEQPGIKANFHDEAHTKIQAMDVIHS
jgi:hypothetical protein